MIQGHVGVPSWRFESSLRHCTSKTYSFCLPHSEQTLETFCLVIAPTVRHRKSANPKILCHPSGHCETCYTPLASVANPTCVLTCIDFFRVYYTLSLQILN